MPINWNLFKNNLTSYFDNNRNSQNLGNKIGEVAEKITSEYETAIIGGGDLNYKNPVVIYNKDGLRTNIEQAFRQGFNVKIKDVEISPIFGNFFSLGVIQFWTGAQLGLLIPPPGSISVVTNVVSIPGVVIPILNLSNSTRNDEFITNIIDFFQKHLQGISGITTALIPAVPVPIPSPFPWQGYG